MAHPAQATSGSNVRSSRLNAFRRLIPPCSFLTSLEIVRLYRLVKKIEGRIRALLQRCRKPPKHQLPPPGSDVCCFSSSAADGSALRKDPVVDCADLRAGFNEIRLQPIVPRSLQHP